jgi:hypothetical protein
MSEARTRTLVARFYEDFNNGSIDAAPFTRKEK